MDYSMFSYSALLVILRQEAGKCGYGTRLGSKKYVVSKWKFFQGLVLEL